MASSADSPQCTPAGMDRILSRMTSAIAAMDSAQDSIVRLPKAELDLLGQIELARDAMLNILSNPDPGRILLQDIFGGDCSRIARVRSVCECVVFSEMNAQDQRLRLCLAACESVEQVLLNLGMGETLSKAQARERALIEGGDEDDASDSVSDECLQHVALATVAETEALEFEQAGDTMQAVQRYEKCHGELAAAIALVPEGDHDLQKLAAHHKQVADRIEYLKSLDGGTVAIPMEDQIQPVDLEMVKSTKRRKRYIVACAAVGAGAGICVLAPVGLALAAGAAVVGGASGAYIATRDGKVGDYADRVGEAVVDGAHKATVKFDTVKTKASGAVADFKERQSQRQSVSDMVADAKSSAIATAGNLDEKLHISDKMTDAKSRACASAGDLDEKLRISNKAAAASAAASAGAASVTSMFQGLAKKK